MSLRIAMIGAGSLGFTRQLVHDILTVSELRATTFALADISAENLERVAVLVRQEIAHHQLPAQVVTTTDRREAIAGADFILCTIRQGGLEAFQHDVEIPLRYGVDQCVGDTLCAGGIFYAQRTIPELLGICRDIRELAKPGALFLDYSNPMAMNVWACHRYGHVPTIGLCHGVQGAQGQIREVIELLARREGLWPEDVRLPASEVATSFAGINQQTWCIEARWRGTNYLPHLLEGFRAHPRHSQQEKVRIDVLERFGYYSTESNGHLSEYLPWYRKRPAEIARWIDTSYWIHGETGGYLRFCREGRTAFDQEFTELLAAPPKPLTAETRSHEHGSYIIEGLTTGRLYRGHFNVINRRHIANLPDGCCIEIPGYVDAHGISLPMVGALPLGCAATCAASVRVQEMAMEAAVHGDIGLLRLALLHDSLVGAVCSTEEVWQMADEMLVALAPWLPQYAAEIPRAEARLAEHVRAGTRVPPRL